MKIQSKGNGTYELTGVEIVSNKNGKIIITEVIENKNGSFLTTGTEDCLDPECLDEINERVEQRQDLIAALT